jgi:hypothetical protein
MPTSRPFAYYIQGPVIENPNIDKIGDLWIGSSTNDWESYPEFGWWMGPDEDLGYVIAKPNLANDQPTPLFDGNTAFTWSSIYKGDYISLNESDRGANQTSTYLQSALCDSIIKSDSKVLFSIEVTGLGQHLVGIGTRSMNYNGDLNGYPGYDQFSMGYANNGNLWYNSQVYLGGLESWGEGDVVDICINNNISAMWVRVNNGNWNNDPAQDPSTNSGGIEIINAPFYPVACPAMNGGTMYSSYPIGSIPSGYQVFGPDITASIGFSRTNGFNDQEFIDLANFLTGQNSSSVNEAATSLNNAGFWHSYPL